MRIHDPSEERTSFQEAAPYDPKTDSHADVAMVYGLDRAFEERFERWRQAGYRMHVMTGVAWGGYADYVRGEWDGVKHYDDAQTAAGGFRLEHGIGQGHDIFYMMPSMAYNRYLGEKLRRVVDAGAIAIHLEEPEFWVRAGYSDGFKREWQDFYGEPWQDQATSPDARYRSAKLKQWLYTRSLDYLFRELKTYAAQRGITGFKCYVPTHSLINYAHWQIVSPESQLLTIPDFDGLIAQVWTGTSRTPNVYRGVRKQRTFEAGYCEYAACTAIVRGTPTMLWQLADPIEDNPNYCWDDYRVNWECTVTGSLLVSDSERFEIMPWPRRIFSRSYPTVNLGTLPVQPLLDAYLERLERDGRAELVADTRRAFGMYWDYYRERGEEGKKDTLGFAALAERTSDVIRFGDVWDAISGFYKELQGWADQADAQRIRDALSAFYHNPTDQRSYIPEEYATELQTVWNALTDVHWPDDTEWLIGHTGVGLAIADTLMFQRGDPEPSDADMSSLYGLAMPLVKHGTALTMAQLERVTDAGYLDTEVGGRIRVLMLTYEGMKPLKAEWHTALANWVRRGNTLIVFGAGDAFDGVREWWNQDGNDYARAQDHLTETLGLGRATEAGWYAVDRGWVIVEPASPAALAHDPQGDERVLQTVRVAHRLLGLPWKESSILVLRRGPYIVAAGMDEADEANDGTGTATNASDQDPATSRRAPTATNASDQDPATSRRAPTATNAENVDPSMPRRAPTATNAADTGTARLDRTAIDSVHRRAPTLPGAFIDLYDARLSIRTDPAIPPDTRWLLYDLARCPDQPWVIAAAGRLRRETFDDHSLTFAVEGMADTTCSVRARLPARPASIEVEEAEAAHEWDAATRTVLIRFANRPAGRTVTVRW